MEPRVWHRHYDHGVPTTLDYPEVRLDDLLRRTAAERPDTTAIAFFGRRTTYAKLDAAADRLAAALQARGVAPGDRVAVFMPNCPQAVISYEGIWRAGAVAVPTNPLYTAAEFAHQAADAGARVVVCLSLMYPRVQAAGLDHVIVARIKDAFPPLLRVAFTVAKERKDGHRVTLGAGTAWFADVLREGDAPRPADRDPGEPAVLMYTGGTTGLPKGAVLTHRNLVANAAQVAAWSPDVTPDERILTAIPLSHSYGMTVAMNHAISRGFTQVIVSDPRDLHRLLHEIARQRPTMFPGVPALYNALASHADVLAGKADLSSINQCLCGAAGLPAEVQRKFEHVAGARLVEGYGLSEASPVTHANPLGSGGRTGTIGVPLPDTDCRIVDEESETVSVAPGEPGVLCVAGPQVMAGYWNRPDETAQAIRTDRSGIRWLHTGDVAIMDADGFFRIVDRKKDLILAAGGLNVYPREVEEVLYAHPLIREAGVIGVPVGGVDQRVKAFVVAEGAAPTADEVVAWCRERLAKYKVPKHVEFRSELPKTFVGKVLRRELARQERERQPA